MDKQIYAALEIADQEVRLAISESLNTRFNIIHVERVACNSFTAGHVNTENVTASVKTLLDNCEKVLGFKIERVILAIPSIHFKKVSLKVRVEVEGVVTVEDIKKAIKKASSTKIDDDLALIQVACVKYTVQGISSRRIPLNEKCSELTVHADLLCTDKKVAFDLVSAVSDTGLGIMDVYLDIYASCKETSLFEQSIDQNNLFIKHDYDTTTLAIISSGRIAAVETLPMGFSDIVSNFVEQYDIDTTSTIELIKYSARLNEDNLSKNPVYMFNKNNEKKMLNEIEIVDVITPSLERWADVIITSCSNILQNDDSTVIITGEGGEMQGLDAWLSTKVNAKVKSYTPDTLGIRRSSLTTLIGLFYAYRDYQTILGNSQCSVNMLDFEKAINPAQTTSNNPDESFTKKLKMLFDNKK